MKNNSITKNKTKILAGLVLSFFVNANLSYGQAADTNTTAPSTYSNALFITLLVIIILLLFFIAAIANVTKNVSAFYAEKNKKDNNAGKIGAAILFFALLANSLQAAGNEAIPSRYIGGLDYGTFYLMLSIIGVELIVLMVLINTIKTLVITEKKKLNLETSKKKQEVKRKTIIDKLNDSIEIEKETDILLDHNYDGIKELDNNLPPWWKYGFYLTIIWATFYLIHYHVSRTGDLQLAEYNKELKIAEEEKAEYMRNAANNIDESNVKLLTAEADLKAGKEVFISTCAACHGKLGEGTVGPNLTDDYWIHKGGVVDIFKSIKYGWPDKGMKSWKEELSPTQMAQITSYIKTLKGTNPPNGKAAQGDLYTEAGAEPNDSLNVAGTDSLKLNNTDSLKKDSTQVKTK